MCRFLQSVLRPYFLLVLLVVQSGFVRAEPLGNEVFAKCEFSIRELVHLNLDESSWGDTDSRSCFLKFKSPTTSFLEMWATVVIEGRDLFAKDPVAYGNGFIFDTKERWSFKGTDLLLGSKMLKTSFTEEQTGKETVLVGYQLIKGNIAQGGPISVPGIRVLRITPEFVVSVNLNFQPLHYEKQTKGYMHLREAVSQELVDIVKSVQVTPGIPGPTAR